MPGLTAVGELTYNGYTFDGTARMKIASEPVRDEADRTVLYTKLVIDVEAVVSQPDGDASGTNGTMADIREALSHDGQALIISNKGFSRTLRINAGGNVKDVNFGPKVEVLNWEPAGSRMACNIKWRVTTCIPACGYTSRYDGRMALNYSIAFSINERGGTTRVVTGYMQIAMTRKGMTLPDVADAYRHTFIMHAPRGFKRTQNYTVDKSKARLDFTITDTEIMSPHAFPAGVINISGTSRTSRSYGRGSTGDKGLAPKTNISMTIERDQGTAGAWTYLLFPHFVIQRMIAMRNSGVGTLIVSESVEEEIFGYSSTFNVGIQALTTLPNLISAGGLWVPVGTDWNTWRGSLQHSMFNQRGTAGLGVQAYEDVIIDLCGAPYAPLNNEASQYTGGSAYYNPGAAFYNQRPDPQKSYLSYTAYIEPQREQSYSQLSPLQKPEEEIVEYHEGLETVEYIRQPTLPDIVQKGISGNYTLTLSGHATRAGYEIPRPAIKTVGTAEAIEVDAVAKSRVVGHILGVDIFETMWWVKYILKRPPGKIDVKKALFGPRGGMTINGAPASAAEVQFSQATGGGMSGQRPPFSGRL